MTVTPHNTEPAIDEETDVGAVDATDSPVLADSFAEYIQAWWKRVRGGQSGVLPVLIGLVIIVVIFQTQKSVFLSAGNLTNLLTQGAAYMLLGMAEVFVLLLGEIDLSIGFVAAIAAFFTVWLSSSKGWPWAGAVVAGLAIAALIGAIQGLIIVRLRLPSFVVTLAGLLGLQGVLLLLIDKAGGSSGGTISITNPVVAGLVGANMAVVVGWIVMAASVAAYALLLVVRDRSRRKSGLAVPPLGLTIAKIVVVAAAGVILVAICNTNRGLGFTELKGVPWVVPFVVVILVAWTVLLARTRFGRYVYAIGGNAEAARRAGINLNRMRVTCFALCSLTAGLAGIVYASRLGSISNNVDGGQLVLYAVAAAVIGGASLFGGQGKMVHALLGGLVIATIDNGMGLINLSAALKLIVTALVLLAAVTVDALARRGNTPG
ncbi:MAG: ABC transporter permease [Actinomycetota bacterium]|nr:ABC transporter permease [Actinomycetota bacterium]